MSGLALLNGGLKGFLENPELAIGVPLVILGAIGAAIVFSPIEIRWPARQTEGGEAHATPETYITVGVILAIVTAIEVALYYIPDVQEGFLVFLLLTLSAMKFLLVVLWFMHLKFDSKIFSVAFTGGFVLALGLFMVVLASLGSSLI
jgi:cytochrome c oxidase subunit 4